MRIHLSSLFNVMNAYTSGFLFISHDFFPLSCRFIDVSEVL